MIADQFDAFLLDLDGVLYLGEEPISTAIEAVQRLIESEKTIRVLTNNPRLPRAALVERFEAAGLAIPESSIVTSGWAAARFLAQKGIRRADVVGSAGTVAALHAEDIAYTHQQPEAVVVAADRETTYLDLQRAMQHIEQGALFVGTNPDTSFPTPQGRGLGAGAVIKALEAATETSATIVGKPEPLMFDVALDTLAPNARVVMVGDNPKTDIRGARRAGVTSILIADEPHPPDSPADETPDYTMRTLADLLRQSDT